MTSSALFWHAVGCPPLRALLPFARSPQWQAFRTSLCSALGTSTARPACRSPRKLYLTLHHRPPPVRATWRDLLYDMDLERVRGKMADLAQLESLLAITIDRCEGDGTVSCAVIDLLDQHATA